MSEVISFRLNKENPREERAIKVLEAKREDGYSIRHIITDAYLKMDSYESEPNAISLKDLNTILSEDNHLLVRIGSGNSMNKVNSIDLGNH